MLTSSEKTIKFSSGYYNEFSVTTEVADIPTASITYTMGHKHAGSALGGACYQEEYTDYIYGGHAVVTDRDSQWGNQIYCKCTRCGATSYGSYLTGTCGQNRIPVTRYHLTCTKDEADTWTTNSSIIEDEGDYIISALIEYEN